MEDNMPVLAVDAPSSSYESRDVLEWVASPSLKEFSEAGFGILILVRVIVLIRSLTALVEASRGPNK